MFWISFLLDFFFWFNWLGGHGTGKRSAEDIAEDIIDTEYFQLIQPKKQIERSSENKSVTKTLIERNFRCTEG